MSEMMRMALVLWLPLAVLAALDILCLVKLPHERRRGLLPATVVLAASALLLFSGEWLLNALGLTWRTVPKELLCAVVWFSGWAAGVLTIRYTLRHDLSKRWMNGAGCALGVLCLASGMLFGSVTGLLWAMGPGETVIEHEGRRVVQGRWAWVGDVSYELYEYHGPLVRGTEPLGSGLEPYPGSRKALAEGKIRSCARQFKKHRDSYEAAMSAASALAGSENRTVEETDTTYPKGVDWMMVTPDGQVEFQLGCSGFASQTRYWGIVYEPEDVPSLCMGAVVEYEPWGDGWTWVEREGDNWCWAERLAPCWFAYFMHF